jgi:serine/threonine protein kinase
MFPWADEDLHDFWERRFPDLGVARKDPNIARWMSTQILGLAKALELIHYCEIDEANSQGLADDEVKRPHGRHGNLHPRNILWFSDQKSPQDQAITGVLQIADFGFAEFYSTVSESLVPSSAVNRFNMTYTAPEVDAAQQVSPQIDIWSFGCILLEFVVWYMYGWRGIDEFSEDRVADSKKLKIRTDSFYSLEIDGTNGEVGRTKVSVMKVSIATKHMADYD